MLPINILINNKLAGVSLSAPSANKFHPLDEAFESLLGLPAGKVKTYYVSKPANFGVRFGQPGALAHQSEVGLALCAGPEGEDGYLRAADRLLAQGPYFKTFVLVRRSTEDPTQWSVTQVRTLKDAPVRSVLSQYFPNSLIQEVEGPDLLAGGAISVAASTPFDLEAFVRQTDIGEGTVREWIDRLAHKRQVVFHGPPGTGKTWIAQRLAKLWAGERGQVETVQFHPGYTYEDFFAGPALKVSESGALRYEVLPGALLEFCDVAIENPTEKFVMILDEINRADLSRTLGELLYALEYRDQPIRLANGPADGYFSMPSNVYLIGTMNSADRSIAIVDHALRRRFAFIQLRPDYELLGRVLSRDGIDPSPMVDLLKKLALAIDDEDYELGSSYFFGHGAELSSRLPAIWTTEVYPYLREYFYGRKDELARWSWESVRNNDLASWYSAGGAVP
jgi:MoxR-like ATPase